MNVLQIGPLTFPAPLVLLLAAYVIGSWLGTRYAAKKGVAIQSPLSAAFLVGLVVARLVFAWRFREIYAAGLLSVLDIRDGGLNLYAGVAAAWVFTLWRCYRQPALRKAVLISSATASAVLVLGLQILSLNAPADQFLPALSMPSLKGGDVSLATYRGKPTVVNLWATWCPPCQREMPLLHQSQVAHPEIHFVFLNQGESAVQINAFLSRSKLLLQNVLLDGKQQVAGMFHQRALPTTLFFDAGGKLVDTRIGELSEATLTQRLNRFSNDSKGNR